MNDLNIEEKFMHRCLQLAMNGLGTTYPNPLVGAVIVHKGKIIGEGWHRKSGEPHAEVMAVNRVKNQDLLRSSTLYVNLEPCSFHGKTPACSRLIMEKKIPRVVVAMKDPNPKVSGSGIQMLRDSGVYVHMGVLEKEAVELNRIFISNQNLKRPYVVLKWAQSADGFIAPENGEKTDISNIWSRQLVHKWRSELQGILIGKNTLISDDPLLDARLWNLQNPVPIVLSGELESFDMRLFKKHKKIYLFGKKAKDISLNNVSNFSTENIVEILMQLYDDGINSILVEGGSQVLNRFIQSALWDEARIFTSSLNLKKGIEAPVLQKKKWIKTEFINGDRLDYYASEENALIYEGKYL